MIKIEAILLDELVSPLNNVRHYSLVLLHRLVPFALLKTFLLPFVKLTFFFHGKSAQQQEQEQQAKGH